MVISIIIPWSKNKQKQNKKNVIEKELNNNNKAIAKGGEVDSIRWQVWTLRY